MHVHTQDTATFWKTPSHQPQNKGHNARQKKQSTLRKLTTKNLHRPDTRAAAPLEYAVGRAIREADCLGHN